MPRPDVEAYACTEAVAVGMLVSLVEDEDRTVEPTQSATAHTRPPVGIVVELLGSGWCMVQDRGVVGGLSALAQGDPYYAGDDGALAASGTVLVGVAATDTTLVIALDLPGVAAPAGSDTQVQFNDGGALGADAGLTFDDTKKAIRVGTDAETVDEVALRATGRAIQVSRLASAAGDAPVFIGLRRHATAITSGDTLAQFIGWGQVGAGDVDYGAFWQIVAAQNWTPGSACGSGLQAYVVPNGGTAAALALAIGQDKTLAVNGEYVSTREAVSFAVIGATTDVAVADGLYPFCVPAKLNGYVLIGAVARVITAGTTGTTDIQLRRSRDTAGTPRTSTDADMLSTKLTIDSAELCTTTAATAAVINTSNDDVQTGDLIFVDVDAVSATAPKGLSVSLEFAKAVA